MENIKIEVTDDDSENTKKKSTVQLGSDQNTQTEKKSSRNTVVPDFVKEAEIVSKSCLGLVTVTRSS